MEKHIIICFLQKITNRNCCHHRLNLKPIQKVLVSTLQVNTRTRLCCDLRVNIMSLFSVLNTINYEVILTSLFTSATARRRAVQLHTSCENRGTQEEVKAAVNAQRRGNTKTTQSRAGFQSPFRATGIEKHISWSYLHPGGYVISVRPCGRGLHENYLACFLIFWIRSETYRWF